MEVAHHRDALDDPLARELEHKTKDAVGRRMLRAQVEDELLDLALFDRDRRKRIRGRILQLAPLDLFGGYVLTTLGYLLAETQQPFE
jgi:hypothetical protein